MNEVFGNNSAFRKDGTDSAQPLSSLFEDADKEARALELSRKSQAALHENDSVAALELARQAQAMAPSNIPVAIQLAVVFCVLQARPEAISTLRLLDAAGAISAEQQRHLSGLLAAEGAIDASVEFAIHATRAEPSNWEFARHCGVMLNFIGRSVEAAGYLVQAARNHNDDALVFFQLSVACAALGRLQQASLFASRAWALEPENSVYIKEHVHYLLQNGQADDAITCILDSFDRNLPETAELWCLMSICRSQAKDFEGAVLAATAGLAMDERHIGLLMQRGTVLCSLGRYDESLADMAAILFLDPAHEGAQRVSFAATAASGRYADAIPFGAALLKSHPDDEPVGRSFLHILTRRFLAGGTPIIDGMGLAELKRKTIHSRRTRRKFSKFDALATQLRVIGALILREVRGRFGRAKLGYLWALFEPLLHISLLVIIIQFMAKGNPPIGESFAVFYFSGIIPYHLFTHIGNNLMYAVRSNRSLLQLPPVTTLDVFTSRALLEFATEVLVALALIVAFLAFGLPALPHDPLRFVHTLVLLGGCAFGLGIMNAALSAYFHSWEKVWSVSIAIMYFTSGTFYTPAMMPVEMRELLEWSPILQGIEMLRSSMFEGHNPPWLDVNYLTTVSLGSVGAGIAIERFTRRKLLELE